MWIMALGSSLLVFFTGLSLCLAQDFHGIKKRGADITFPGTRVPDRGTLPLYLEPPEIMYKHGNKLYVPIFQAIANPTAASREKVPTGGHKDIWLDKENNIIIKVGNYDPAFWVGATNPRHQVRFAMYYKNKDKFNSWKPRIRKFLVPLSAYIEATNSRYMTTDEYANIYDMSASVDRFLPNQHGFTGEALEILRRNAVPGTLTTYLLDEDEDFGSHEGKISTIEKLRREYEITDVPGIELLMHYEMNKLKSFLEELEGIHHVNEQYRTKKAELQGMIDDFNNRVGTAQRLHTDIFAVSLGQLEKRYKHLGKDLLEKLKSIYGKQKALKNQEKQLSRRIYDFNKKRIFDSKNRRLDKNKLDSVPQMIEEVKKRQGFYENYIQKKYIQTKNPSAEQFRISFNDERVKDIQQDSNFRDASNPNERMDNFLNMQKENKKYLKDRDMVLKTAAAIHKFVRNDISSEVLSPDSMLLHVMQGDQERLQAFKLGMNIADLNKDQLVENMIHHVCNLLEGENLRAQKKTQLSRLIATIDQDQSFRKIALVFPEETEYSRTIKKQTGVEVAKVVNGKITINNRQTIIVANEHTEISIHCSPAKLSELGSVFKDVILPHNGFYGLKSLTFELKNSLDGIAIKEALTFCQKQNFIIDNVNIGNKLKYDPVANLMYEKQNDGSYKELGTPRICEKGFLKYNNHYLDRKTTTILQEKYREIRNKLKDKTYTGVVYTKGKDLIWDKTYQNQFQKKSKFKTEVIFQIGDSTQAKAASKYLYERYTEEGKKAWVFRLDSTIPERYPIEEPNIDQADKIRITVVGHGERAESNIKIDGMHASEVVDHAIKKVKRMQHDALNAQTIKPEIGKISFVACNNAEENIEDNIIKPFWKEVNDVVKKHGVSPDISVRAGLVQVDADGRKQYGLRVGQEIQWQYLEQMPIKARINEQGQVEYLVKVVGKDMWSLEKPSVQTISKIVLVTKAFGNVDAARDFDRRTILPMQVDASGALDNMEIIDIEAKNEIGKGKIFIVDDQSDTTMRSTFSADKNGVQGALVQLEANQWTDRLAVASHDVVKDLPDPEKWSPLMDTAFKIKTGETQVELLNFETNERKIVKMERDDYVQFKKRTSKRSMSVANLPSLSKTSIGMTGSGSVMGLGFFINSIIQMARAKKCKKDGTCPDTPEGNNLVKSLEIHAYIGLVEGGVSAVIDSIQIAEIAVSFNVGRKATNGIVTMTARTSKFLKFSSTVGKIGMGVGAVGSVVGLGFSSYQLHHAQTKAQKIQFGLQVAFDSLNVAITGVAIGATIAAAVTGFTSAIASAAGPVGIAVAIVGILVSSITTLVFEFKETRKNARLVGEYFYDLDNIYQKGGFEYNSSTETLDILPHAIVEIIDTVQRRITLDSQYIYRTKHGRTGSGKKNYFFWYKDFPKLVKDRNQAINIREGIGYRQKVYSLGQKRVKTIILPVVPKSYISYKYNRLPFCTAMRDKGFDVIRRLEQDYRFDYDFYIVPGEQIVDQITHEYVKTHVRVKVDENVTVIFSPRTPSSLQNFYTFTVETSGKMHHIIISDGFSYVLSSVGHKNCSWFVDAKNVTYSTISFDYNKVILGSVTIKLVQQNDRLFVTNDFGMLAIDPFSQRVSYIGVTKPPSTSAAELKDHLKTIAKFMSNQQFVEISEFEMHRKYIGKAYYEIAEDRFLYSDFLKAGVSDAFKKNVEMLGKIQNSVYFMSEEDGRQVIWRTHAHNHSIAVIYNLFCGNQTFNITKLNTQEGAIYLIQIVQTVSLIYRLLPYEGMLISIDGSQENVLKLGELCFPSLIDHLPIFEKLVSVDNQFPGECVYAKTYPILPLKQTTTDGVTQHFWLYMNDTISSGYVQDQLFCKTSLPPVAHGIIAPNMTNECDDLTLRDIQVLPTSEKVYFFYCENNKSLHYQVASYPATEVRVPGGIKQLEDFRSTKYIRSTNGGLYIFKETGNVSLAAVTFSFLREQKNWKQMIYNMSRLALHENYIIILNLTNTNGKVLKAWFDVVNDILVVVSPDLDIQDIVYLGPTPDPYLAWLYDKTTRGIILHQLLTETEVEEMLIETEDTFAWKNDSHLFAKIVASNLTSVEFTDGSVFCLDDKGVMFNANHFGGIRLLGVNQTWLRNHQEYMEEELTHICLEFSSLKIITMGHRNLSAVAVQHEWYHCEWETLITLTLMKGDTPYHIGQNSELKTVYFMTDNSIKEIQVQPDSTFVQTIKEYSCKYATVQGKTLAVQPLPSQHMSFIPILDNVNTLVVATEHNTDIHISTQVWMHYQSIMVTGIGSDGEQQSRIVIDAPVPCLYPWEEDDGNTVFYDKMSDHTVVLEDFTFIPNITLHTNEPTNNHAVLEFSMCTPDTLMFVTSRPRLSRYVSKNGGLSKYVYFFLLGLGAVAIISFVTAWRCRKKRRN